MTARLITALLTAWAIAPAVGEEALKDIPHRIDPAKTPAPKPDTILLWSFEEEVARDRTANRNHGKSRGKPRGTESGRHGKGLRLSGGEDAAYAIDVKGFDNTRWGEGWDGVTIDFWCRIEETPGSTQCLLDWGSARTGPDLRLQLDREGRLSLSVREGDSYQTAVGEEEVPVKRWFHVGIHGRNVYQPNRIFADKSGAEVLVNGFPYLRAYYGFPRPQTPAAIAVGNALSFDRGFVGQIDELRLTDSNRQFCRLIQQEWLDPEGKRPIARPDHCFKNPQAILLRVSFDTEQERSMVRPPVLRTPTQETQAPRAAALALETAVEGGNEDGGEKLEIDEDEAEQEIEESLEGTGPLKPTSGVRGQALVVRGGPGRIDLPKGADLTEGTVEFWVKPGDWDNLTVKPSEWREGHGYRDSILHLLSLHGVPRVGEGDPVPLVSVNASRLRAKVPVTDEFEDYFPSRPRVPVEPHQWTHVLCRWGRGPKRSLAIYFDGRWAGKGQLAAPEIWEAHRPAFLEIGNVKETAFDELRLYAYPFARLEIQNSLAEYRGEPLQELNSAPEAPASVHSIEGLKIDPKVDGFSYLYPLGEVNVDAETLLHRFSGGWNKDWVLGTSTEGPLSVYFAYRLSVGKLLVALTNVQGADRAEVEFRVAKNGRMITKAVRGLDSGKGGAVLDVGLLPEGDHALSGVLLDGKGGRAGVFKSTFHRVPIPWLHNKLGLPDTPPPPFEPIAVEAQNVTAVGRKHSVAPDGNFSSIVVRNEEILASPIRFEAQVGGKAVTLSGGGPAKFGACDAVEANWSADASAAAITVHSAVKFEYDGMAKYDIEVRPRAGEVSVERLSLIVPLKAKYGQLAHVLPVGGRFRGYVTAGFLPSGDGRIWDSKTWTAQKRVYKGVGNFVSNVWLGGMVRGLVWFADNDRGWVPSADHPAATVTRRGDVVTLGLHFISESFVLKEPRAITYGLMATPPKPLPEDHRLWNRGHTPEVGSIGGRLTSCDAFAPWEVPVVNRKASSFAYWPRNDDWEFARKAAARQRVCGQNKYPPGVALMLYHDKDHCPRHPDSVPYFGWIWRCCSYPQSRIDHLVWYMDRWIAHGMDGIYIDDVYPNADWNMYPIGTAYIHPDGRKQPGVENFRYRQYLKRLYALYHQHGKRPIITTHMTSTLIWPFHSFVTVIFDCEEAGRFHDRTVTYMDAWPLERFQTIDVAERTGVITVPMLKGQYVDDTGRSLQQQFETRRSYAAMWMLFDHSLPLRIPGKGAEGHQFYDAVARRYYGVDVEVHPFWRNEHLVSVEPILKGPVTDQQLPKARFWTNKEFRDSIGKQPLRATIYRKGSRALLVVANFLRASVGARVRLRLDALGVPQERQAAIRLTDIDDWPPPPEPEDLTAPPPKLDDANKMADETGLGGDDDLDVGDFDPEAAEKATGQPSDKKPPPLELKEGTLSLDIRGHDFRAIELIW